MLYIIPNHQGNLTLPYEANISKRHQFEFLINEENHIKISTGYMHGVLHEMFNTDLFTLLNAEELLADKKNFNTLMEGSHLASVFGVQEKCILYIWKAINMYKVLLVSSKDIDAIEHAQECFQERKHVI